MDTPPLYYDYGSFLRERFPHFKVQKIAVNAGFTCPNRNGEKGWGGCTYCNNQTFNPAYCDTGLTVTQQIEEGRRFFARKYPDMRYLAYFQAYTSTYAPLQQLVHLYEEALAAPGVVGLVIGTRPDCMPHDLLDYLVQVQARGRFVLVEYGIESVYDSTLRRINRGHDYACAAEAVERTARAGLPVGGHVILGLPGEEVADIAAQATVISKLPLTTLKLHQLQLIRGTRMAQEYARHPEEFHLFAVDEYVELVIDYVERLRPDLVVERFVSQSPKALLLALDWGLKNHEFTDKVRRRMAERGTFQGRLSQI